ncbi:MAG: hypothetical protein KGJ23_00435 [Euryarchaeota archaeon]|nr:hypothetical protein [Euryarchaeota archaeon]MDE1835063.1 hypothetical protein [Euryarchaeota archaeon]MDE1879334.1 hypothetical protein [Euryarchaeota archaeon]MDE2044975.1 hypothetical protein [Thermoplasmata archaeon]
MPLVLQWSNLWDIAVPFFICISLATIFTVFLWRVAWKSGLPHRREPCASCVFERELIKNGECHKVCAVNVIPTLPLLLFLFDCSFGLFFLLFPALVMQFLFPAGFDQTWSEAVIAALGATSGGAAILLVGYFVQDKAWHRELFFRIAAAGTTTGLLLAVLVPTPIDGWAVGSFALNATPFGMVAVMLTAGIEHRARWGRPVLGLRALGATTLPLFFVALVACARILFILNAAYGWT